MLESNFQFKPSQVYLSLLMTTIAASALIIVFLPFESWIKAVLFLILFIYGGKIIWQFGLLKSKYSIIQLQYQKDNQWLLHTRTKIYLAEICGDSTVTHCISILRFRVSKRVWAKSCIVFRDSLGRDRYRELVVRLKFG